MDKMPVINLNITELNSLIGKEYPVNELVEKIPMIGADVGEPDGDILPVEFFPDRPDMFSVEGAARALRYFLASEEELREMPLPDYHISPSGIKIHVDRSMSEVRPFVVGAVVRGVKMTDELIRSLMDHQEKLHLSIGRRRVKAAIGVHDISKVEWPFTYTTREPDFSFIPLMKDREMTLEEILNVHEKGIAYRCILEGRKNYPLILDNKGRVLSFPPIINGVLTAVNEGTTDVFIDVTGMEMAPINLALNIFTTALAERGGKIESVEVEYEQGHPDAGGKTCITPDLSWGEMKVPIPEMNRLLNTHIPAKDWILPLKRMTLRAATQGENVISVAYPPYRGDILHVWDIFEDAAIGLGYDRIPDAAPKSVTTGLPLSIIPTLRRFQRAMVGLGFSEVKALTLTGEKDGYLRMRLPVPEDDILILNPVTEDHTRLRTSLLPGLLSILTANKHRDLPQRLFEAGIVVKNGKNHYMGGGVIIHSKTGFTDIKSTVISMLLSFGKEAEFRPLSHPSFIAGRCAVIIIDESEIGYFGELHPEAITNFQIEYPVAGFEMELELP